MHFEKALIDAGIAPSEAKARAIMIYGFIVIDGSLPGERDQDTIAMCRALLVPASSQLATLFSLLDPSNRFAEHDILRAAHGRNGYHHIRGDRMRPSFSIWTDDVRLRISHFEIGMRQRKVLHGAIGRGHIPCLFPVYCTEVIVLDHGRNGHGI